MPAPRCPLGERAMVLARRASALPSRWPPVHLRRLIRATLGCRARRCAGLPRQAGRWWSPCGADGGRASPPQQPLSLSARCHVRSAPGLATASSGVKRHSGTFAGQASWWTPQPVLAVSLIAVVGEVMRVDRLTPGRVSIRLTLVWQIVTAGLQPWQRASSSPTTG